MKRISLLSPAPDDFILEALLTKRKAPLSEEGLRNTLNDLTYHVSGDVTFYLAVFVKPEAADLNEIRADQIDRVDIMFADDNERYLPVFSTMKKMKAFKPALRENEAYFSADKNDLLNFLALNGKVAACVLNPGEDDLLLHRMQLQNLIRVGQGLKEADRI